MLHKIYDRFLELGQKNINLCSRPPSVSENTKCRSTTVWGRNSWASSDIVCDSGHSTYKTVSKWVRLDDKNFEIQAWSHTQSGRVRYGITLYDTKLKRLLSIDDKMSNSIGHLEGNLRT